jgi:glycosyltransferase involved in cell wall biosynthesis
MSPKVTIILPTYNRAGLITETIESITRQTYANWELIIMDDGSDDNTEEIIRKIKDERIRYHKAARTGMVSKLKNTGIRNAEGELIAFNDSDDLWAPTKLEKQVKALSQYPEAGFCLTGGYTFRNKNVPVDYLYKVKSGIKYGNIFTSIFRSEVSCCTPVLLFHKKCIEIAGFFDETKPFSDPEFIAALASHFNAVILFEPLFYRRLHDETDSNEHWEKRNYEWIKVIRTYQSKGMLDSAVANEALFKLYLNFGEKYLRLKQRMKAMKLFFIAWRYKPASILPARKISKTILRYFTDQV